MNFFASIGRATLTVLAHIGGLAVFTGQALAGIVNPPNPKAKHWVNDSLPADPHEWKANADLVTATWWQDWAAWIAERGGEMVPAPDHQGSDEYPPIEKAPGSYVRAT